MCPLCAVCAIAFYIAPSQSCTYNFIRWRDWCGLPTISTWDDLRGLMSNKTVANYAVLYESPNDLDLWSAGISETPLTGNG